MGVFNQSIASTAPFLILSFSFAAHGQIVPDTTLPTNSIVSPESNTSVVTGGTQIGENLFHSFDRFSIPTGEGAFFDNAIEIQNIFSRVTGNSISDIDGFIRANGTANLFLLNPNGILFGENASLELGGSFFGSSADRILFENGIYYSATDTQTAPLLTVNVPIGLQFGETPGDIVNRSRLAAFDPVPTMPPEPVQSEGLSISPGNTIALLGGNLIFEGGTLSALDGAIELGGVGANSRVNLTPRGNGFAVGYENVENFGDIQFDNAASVRLLDLGGGGMQIRGRQIVLDGSSIVDATNLGELPGAAVTVTAQEAIELRNLSQMSVETFGVGTGGNFLVETGRLSITDGSLLLAGSRSPSIGGNLTVRSRESVVVSGAGETIASTLAVGRGNVQTRDLTFRTLGNLTIETQQLLVSGGAQVGRVEFNANGGNVTIDASESVEVMGTSANGFISQVQASSFISGTAGDLTINTGRLAIRDGAVVTAGTQGRGNSGLVTVRARESVELSGTNPSGFPSGLTATSTGAGNAGNITIETDRLTVRDGSVIAVSSVSFVPGIGGAAGNLTIRANEIDLSGSNGREFPFSISQLTAQTLTAGDGGAILLEVDRLRLRNGGSITAGTLGSGNGGTLTVRASSLELSGRTPAPERVQTGIGGVLTGGSFPSTVSAGTASSGNAGEISIETNSLVITDGGLITANTQLGSGEGGNIRIRAAEAIELRDAAQVNVQSTGSGNPGSIEVGTDFLRLDDGGRFNASSTTGLGGNINLTAQDIQLRRQSQIVSAGSPTFPTSDGNIGINAETLVLLEGSQILTSSLDPQGGSNITIAPLDSSDLVLLQSPDSLINAEGELAIEGELDPDPAEVPEIDTTDVTSLISQGCQDYEGSEFYVTGRGGLPPNPRDILPGSSIVEIDWVELTDETASAVESSPTGDRTSTRTPIEDPPLIEAQGWYTNESGQVVLTANPISTPPHSSGIAPIDCQKLHEVRSSR
ncbi:MAG: S-layer family protein [Cyanobacteriota bacterium]|nr:S-layer family protein [Cyanobacteriota bacterium]